MDKFSIKDRVTYRSTSNKLNGRSGVISGPEHPLLGFPVDFKGMPAGIYCSRESLEPEAKEHTK